MKIAVYPGSFNPFHEGHLSVLNKALAIFEKVIIAQGINPDKSEPQSIDEIARYLNPKMIRDAGDKIILKMEYSKQEIEVIRYEGLLKDYINTIKPNAIIKGIRDPNDFLYEQKMQYINEDLGIIIPTFYIISDKNLVHKSSSAIRIINKFKEKK